MRVHDRLNRLAVDHQDAPAEQNIVALRTKASVDFGERMIADAVTVTCPTRTHPEIRQGSSMRGAIDCVLIAEQLAALRHLYGPDDDRYNELIYDAMIVSLSGRIHLDESVEATPERVVREIWEEHFMLQPAIAEPG